MTHRSSHIIRFSSTLFAATLLCSSFLLFAPGMCAEASAAASGPLAALATAQKGIDEANSDLFTQAVDIDSVLNKATGTLTAAVQKQVAEGKMGGSNAMLALSLAGAGDPNSPQGAMIKQMLLSEVKSFVAAGINGGYFAGEPNGKVTSSSGSFGSLIDIKKMSKGRKEIVPGKVISQKGEAATVSATLVDHGTGRFPLMLGMEQQNGRWRVTEVTNAADLLERATQSAR